MIPDEVPNGSIAAIGDPMAARIVRKDSDGGWWYINTSNRPSFDDVYKNMTLLWVPPTRD